MRFIRKVARIGQPIQRGITGSTTNTVRAVVAVELQSNANFPQIVDTGGSLPLLLGIGQGGQQHGGKNGDDGDYDQQFNQSKSRQGLLWRPDENAMSGRGFIKRLS